MELSEQAIKTFEIEGFPHVFEWEDPAGTVYEPHSHRGKVSLFVTDGSITFDISGTEKVVSAGERFDVPIDEEHSAVVGPEGWRVVVGAELEEDT